LPARRFDLGSVVENLPAPRADCGTGTDLHAAVRTEQRQFCATSGTAGRVFSDGSAALGTESLATGITAPLLSVNLSTADGATCAKIETAGGAALRFRCQSSATGWTAELQLTATGRAARVILLDRHTADGAERLAASRALRRAECHRRLA
jgi:hypothetical protein